MKLLGEYVRKDPIGEKIDAVTNQKPDATEQDIPHKASDEEIDDILSD